MVSMPLHRRLDLRLRREEVVDRKATIGPPALGNLQHLRLGRHVIKAIDLLDGPTDCEVTRQNHVGRGKGDDEKAMHRARADARDRRECRLDLLIGALPQDLVAQFVTGVSEGREH